MTTTDQWVGLIEPVARELLGEPNKRLSNSTELRFGSRGSMSVDLEKGVWYDNETNEGGGVIDLIEREVKGADPGEWLRERGFDIGEPPPRKPASAPTRRIDKVFPYPDGDGTVLFEVVRYIPKDFRQRRPDPTQPDGYTWATRGVKQVPYRLPELLEALGQEQLVFVVEGEKCVDKMWSLGLPATCNAGGAGKWLDRLAQYFVGADVVIIPDFDPQKTNPKTSQPMFTKDGEPILPGQDHAMAVGRSLDGVATRVRVLDLGKQWPKAKPKDDIYDWFAAGNDRQMFDVLVEMSEVWSEQLRLSYPGGGASNVRPTSVEPGGLEDRIALDFSALHTDNLRYVAMWNRWLQWDGIRWSFETTLRAFDLARDLCRDAKSASSKTVAAVISLARTDRRQAATVEQWDTDPWLLGTPGGTVDLRTGETRPARQEDYITKITKVAPADEPPEISCPLWLKFLQRVTGGRQELQDFLQRVCGYSLTGMTVEDSLFFLWGKGANGKSVYVRTVASAIGDYHKTASMDMFTIAASERHPTDLAMLRGARLVTAIETEEGKRWDEAKLKALTGGDRIAARFMRQDFFEFTPQFKLTIAGNHKPVFRNVDDAIRRRVKLVPFTVTIPEDERDLDLSAKLEKELSGILRWMIDGCLAWRKDGLKPPASVLLATDDYLSGQDDLQRFIDDACEVGPNEYDTIAHLWDGWVDWAEDNREFVGTQRRFGDRLEDKGYRRDREGEARSRVHRGIRCIRENTKKFDAELRRRANQAKVDENEARANTTKQQPKTSNGLRDDDIQF